ncbi:acetolactate synthase large subunit [Bosea sp. (in: a-proteobacteria)]|uniref:acetolactate synthase large subunit n=1 Tax=Bosea sp. (in: a-proteobacteria) TaxID=1871050 RepID=UPI0026030078|nr:acetolactate synthase large subunit [Bosea sp. (in: a-proteobacteria)]MCO5093147.1 acetolactate synthase large subunit [Bosea sp. (in: a-proteobacteria)]
MASGADRLCEALLAHGVDTCFANPGTSEMHFVAALDRRLEMRCILGLSEGVVTGAADGYARMAGKPAATLLHCGPGLANGIANLHNARRAHTPIINVVGDHASYHLRNDPPLAMDIEGLARPVSTFVRRIEGPGAIEAAVAEGYAAAVGRRGVATLVLPGDAAWNEAPPASWAIGRPPPAAMPDERTIAAAADALRSGRRCVVLLGGPALRAKALEHASRIARATGASLMAEPSNGRIERRPEHAPLERMPYALDEVVARFRDVDVLIVAGAQRPTAFFAYPGKPTFLHDPGALLVELCGVADELEGGLEALAEAVAGAGKGEAVPPGRRALAGDASFDGLLNEAAISHIVAELLPENAIVVDESITCCRGFFALSDRSVPHDYLQLTGGAIGIGIPLSAGAAVASPGRKVITLQADGSAMYTTQGLWTQAREQLDVVTILLSNRAYAILEGEMQRVGAAPARRNARRMLRLDDPGIDWVSMARAHGVDGRRATTVAAFRSAFADALSRPGPVLIEAVL